MNRCGKCDFTADELTEHAADSGHMLCIVCERRSLTTLERQTCARCVANVRANLADILTDYALLEPTSTNRLTLLGDGTMQRMPRLEELERGTRDEWTSDPLPVLPALASWEDWVREEYHDEKGAVPATLSATVDYLMANLDTGRSIAQTFPGFDDLASEIAHHRRAIRREAALSDDPVSAPARCFDCNGELVRTYRPAAKPSSEIRKGLDSEGLTDDWTCAECRGVYDQQSYFLALRAHHAEAPGEWRRMAVAAWLVDRPFRTVQTWVRELIVRSVCDAGSQRLLVWMPDVKAASDATSRRQRSA